MSQPSAVPPSRRTLLVIAVVMVASAVGLGYAGFTRSPRLYAPPAIAYLVALIFVVTAARLLEMASGRPGRGDWFALVFFGASAAIEWWIALASPPGQCRSTGGDLSLIGGGGFCKAGFGVAAAISTALAIYCASRVLRGKPVGESG
jgi:hypothetical protein